VVSVSDRRRGAERVARGAASMVAAESPGMGAPAPLLGLARSRFAIARGGCPAFAVGRYSRCSPDRPGAACSLWTRIDSDALELGRDRNDGEGAVPAASLRAAGSRPPRRCRSRLRLRSRNVRSESPAINALQSTRRVRRKCRAARVGCGAGEVVRLARHRISAPWGTPGATGLASRGRLGQRSVPSGRIALVSSQEVPTQRRLR
jgi:hypothetical protein